MLKSTRVLVLGVWVLGLGLGLVLDNFKSCVLVLEACVLDASTAFDLLNR